MAAPGRMITGAAGGVFSYFVRHRTAANLLLLLMLASGIWAGTQIRSQFFPDSVRETVTINVAWPGAGPADVDNAIVGVLEPRLLSVDGVEETFSYAREGSARITLNFEDNWDMSRATDEVKAAVDSVNTLPESAEDPVVRRGAYRDRITDVVIHGPADVVQLTRYASEFQGLLFREGISRTNLGGVDEPVIRVSAPESRLIQHGVTLAEIANAIGDQTETNPAGDVSAGSTRIRTGVERRSAEEIGGIAIRTNPDGSRLFVRDVASVELEGAESGVAFYWRENPAVTIRVDRNQDGDSIRMQAAVQRVADEFAKTLPEGVEIRLTRTRAQAISDRLGILKDNGLIGLGLVLIFLFLFLSARTAFWVAMGIPAAMAATVAIMWMVGLTINMISLFALILCLGIVVDDAIVVGEHADALARKGLDPAAAAEQSARKMAAPVFSASITTIIAFGGLVAIGGRFGELILDIPLTVIVVMIASLAECFLILPAHMRHALAAREKQRFYDWPSRQFDRGFQWFKRAAFRPFVKAMVEGRYLVIGAAFGLLFYSLSMVVTGEVGWRFFNAPERGTIDANIAMLPGATRADTRAQVKEMVAALDRVNASFSEQYGADAVDYSIARIGGLAGWRRLAGADTKDTDLLGAVSVTLTDPDLRPFSQFEVIGAWRDEIRRSPRLETLALFGGRSGPGGDSIHIRFAGADVAALKAAAEATKSALSRFPAANALEDTLPYDKSELILTLTPKGEALGLSTEQIGRELRNRLSGVKAAEFLINSRTATVEVGLPQSELKADYLQRALIRTPSGGYAALSEVVEVETRLGFGGIRREDGTPVVTVTGDISGDDDQATVEINEALVNDILPDVIARYDVSAEIRGLAEQENDFLTDATRGFIACIVGIYLVLAWIFASWTRPIVILLAIPFGLVGTIWGHHWFDIPLSMFTVVGLIGMSGIIVNDSIVLITTIDEYAKKRGLIPALIDGVCDRLRAVLLTTLTTVAGLAPLLYETSRQAQFLKPTVITMAFGLSFGLVLVLAVTPAFMVMQHDVGRALASARRMAARAVRRRSAPG